ncbi:response regulator [Salinisphaera sp. SPP-AMP-43]|uniref:response regulator transcription factor n=1 Tax=Salinisphaera sp. SPP-AMP-43 TaxID=3121288 RepID=UPI003C6E2D75
MSDSAPQSLIAVIDDDTAFAMSMAALLNSDGFEATLFDSAESFLADETERSYCCLLIDWMLPGMRGTALCRHLAAQAGHPPMILMSGARIDAEVRRNQLAPEVEFMEKPFDPDWLLTEVAQRCRRHA